jgi:hypothetical protein
MSEQTAPNTPQAPRPRNLVLRGDGKAINVFRRPGQLFVCGFG